MELFLNILGLNNLNSTDLIWMIIGTIGQLIFFSRWVIQWFYSEKNKTSVIPIGFWWCSIIGGLITLVYAINIGSFPFILAQLFGIIVYTRNLYLIYSNK
tara:strand:+ start:195 stop:494 length:300 start_codon:yes stop_codon:yes gene_type:complete